MAITLLPSGYFKARCMHMGREKLIGENREPKWIGSFATNAAVPGKTGQEPVRIPHNQIAEMGMSILNIKMEQEQADQFKIGEDYTLEIAFTTYEKYLIPKLIAMRPATT